VSAVSEIVNRNIISSLKISEDKDFKKHLNKYDVIHLDIQWFLSNTGNVDVVVPYITQSVLKELREFYPEVLSSDVVMLPDALSRIKDATGQKFIVIIDEWDVLIRDEAANKKVQDEYIVFLKELFKGTEPNEVKKLCAKYDRDFEKVKCWYDGYLLEKYHIYNPRAVVSVMLKGKYKSYWSETGSYEAIVPLINMDFDGLKTAIIEMLSGSSVKVNTRSFKNDTVNFTSRDDVLTYLIHLGYLGYDQDSQTAFVPNEELRQELTTATECTKWNELLAFQQESALLLEATLDMDSDAAGDGIEKIHNRLWVINRQCI